MKRLYLLPVSILSFSGGPPRNSIQASQAFLVDYYVVELAVPCSRRNHDWSDWELCRTLGIDATSAPHFPCKTRQIRPVLTATLAR